MEKNYIDKIYGNINYNTIQDISGKTSIGVILVKNFIGFPNVAYALACMFCAYYLANDIVKAETHTKDVKKVKAIYDEIIRDYNKMNKVFDLENPIEIHTMYNYLLYKGYLSKGKEFEFSDTNLRDINTLYGANIISGQGVCRHIGIMLRDIFNDKGINSNVLSAFIRPPVITNHTDDNKPEQTIEELYNFVRQHINNEEMRKVFNELIEKVGIIISKQIGNHLITLAVKDGKSYILDPTQNRIYRLSQDDKSIVTDSKDDRIKICYCSLPFLEKHKDIKNIKSNILLPSTTLEEEQLLIQRTRDLCDGNQDIFAQFYNEHSEMYAELTDKLMGMKQRNLLFQNKLVKKMVK
ncbi:MAG: hypothetical protein WCR80_02120 [Bacilli bacterium]